VPGWRGREEGSCGVGDGRKEDAEGRGTEEGGGWERESGRGRKESGLPEPPFAACHARGSSWMGREEGSLQGSVGPGASGLVTGAGGCVLSTMG